MNEIEALKAELEEVKLAYRMAIQMGQFKAGFLARTSHELRSPLNSLIGLHQLILADLCESPEEEREFIQQAHQSALKLMKLIDEVVAVSKTQYGVNPLQKESISIAKIFKEVERLTHLQAANRNYPLLISFPEPDVYVYADFKRIVQALLTLVDTSMAHAKEGAIKISIAPSSKTDQVIIQIELNSSVIIWHESIELMETSTEVTVENFKTLKEINFPSSGMAFILSQDLLTVMDGTLEIISIPSPEEEKSFTRLHCSIPKARD